MNIWHCPHCCGEGVEQVIRAEWLGRDFLKVSSVYSFPNQIAVKLFQHKSTFATRLAVNVRCLLYFSDVLALPIFKQEESSLPPDNENKILPFQYVLCAATSPAVKLHDETLTYLNQG